MSSESQHWKSSQLEGILLNTFQCREVRGGKGSGLVSIAYYISFLSKIPRLRHMLSITEMLFHHRQQETQAW